VWRPNDWVLILAASRQPYEQIFHSTTVLSDKPSIAEPTLSAAEARSRTNSGNA
jgi:hypothetical protein